MEIKQRIKKCDQCQKEETWTDGLYCGERPFKNWIKVTCSKRVIRPYDEDYIVKLDFCSAKCLIKFFSEKEYD